MITVKRYFNIIKRVEKIEVIDHNGTSTYTVGDFSIGKPLTPVEYVVAALMSHHEDSKDMEKGYRLSHPDAEKLRIEDIKS